MFPRQLDCFWFNVNQSRDFIVGTKPIQCPESKISHILTPEACFAYFPRDKCLYVASLTLFSFVWLVETFSFLLNILPPWLHTWCGKLDDLSIFYFSFYSLRKTLIRFKYSIITELKKCDGLPRNKLIWNRESSLTCSEVVIMINMKWGTEYVMEFSWMIRLSKGRLSYTFHLQNLASLY